MNDDKNFIENYWLRYQKIFAELKNDNSILELKDAIKKTSLSKGRLIFIGNGASASLASHAATDFTKQAKITSIAFNDHNLITALSNDFGYEEWVLKAIEYYTNPNDMVIFISVSGESRNLVNALEYAKKEGYITASLTGSDINNTLKNNSDYSLWVNSKAYNIVESSHTILITLIIDLLIGSPEYSVDI